jgi:glutathione synthase/RimK-type ligase-like ATP-grasp enzyme
MYNGLVTRAGTEQVFWTIALENEGLNFDEFGPEPYLLQAEIAKAADVRVTVVGERVFAVAIRTPVGAPTDWRRTSLDLLQHEIIELPEDVEALCCALVQTYDLRFAAIDFVLTCDGRFDFLELNPNGQWAWLEDATGVPLCAAMADLLLDADG